MEDIPLLWHLSAVAQQLPPTAWTPHQLGAMADALGRANLLDHATVSSLARVRACACVCV